MKLHRYGLKSSYGFIIPHSSELRSISSSNTYSIQAEWSQLRLDQKAWENCHCFYELGLGAEYTDFGNPVVLGAASNLYFFIEPYLKYNQKIFSTFRVGIGVNYLSQVYDSISNPENLFFSRPISLLLFTGLSLHYQISEKISMSLDGHYKHISNGGVKQPNKGMNFAALGLSINYRPENTKWPEFERQSSHNNKAQYYLGIFGSMRTAKADSLHPDQRSAMLGIQTGVVKPLTHLNAVGLGAELSYNGNYRIEGRRGANTSPLIVSPMLQHHFFIGRVNFSQQLGIYLYHQHSHRPDRLLFQRYALNYIFKSGWYIGGSLKAHAHVAEHMVIQTGYFFLR
ncbi:MAG: acyloxyacyl hydrolase [Cyclobacteriaceae bacterium]